MSGSVERVVEDWLTSASERAYQLAYAAYLARLGHTIKYISPHSALEHGKDIISVHEKATHAYQLKAGSLDNSLWQKIEGEVRQASIVPIDVPGMAVRVADRAHLVLTGQVTDTVRNLISLTNVDLVAKGYAPVELVQLSEMVHGFVQMFESFCPQEIKPLHDLIRLYLQNGRAPQNKPLVFDTFSEIAGEPNRPRAAARAVNNVVVASQFASAHLLKAENHIALIDTWVIAACVILRLAQRFELHQRYCIRR